MKRLHAQLQGAGRCERRKSVALYDLDELSQWLDRLEFVVHVDGVNFLAHRGEEAIIDDASRIRPFGIEWTTSESGFGRLFFIVSNLSGSQCAVHRNNNRSLQCIVKDSSMEMLEKCLEGRNMAGWQQAIQFSVIRPK